MAIAPLHLDDLVVGRTFTSRAQTLDAKAIVDFASEFDPQPFHTDPAAAQDSFFGGLAASGWHTAALSMRLIVESVPFAQGTIGAGVELTWPTPTRPGDTLHVESMVLDIAPSRSKPGQAIVSVESLTRNQDGAVRQRMVAKLMVFARPENAPSSRPAVNGR